MGGEPDDRVLADHRPRASRGGVVLADVHAVGARGRGEVRAVVEDEQRAVLVRRAAELGRRGEHHTVAGVLLAQLHDVGSAGQCRVQARGAEGRIADEVQARAREPLASIVAHEPKSKGPPWGSIA